MKNLYTLYYLHRLNTVVNLGMLGKISSYPTYPIAVILKMAMHLEDPERTALQSQRRAACLDRATTVDKGHGRIEKRTLELTTWLEDYLGDDWPGCRQVFRLQRERRTGEKVEVEVVFGITSLSRERAGAAKLLDAVRAHWGIENGLHGRRDGTLKEDASRVRKGSGPQVMAVLRNLVIYLCSFSGKASLAAATRHYMCHPEKSVELVSTPIRE